MLHPFNISSRYFRKGKQYRFQILLLYYHLCSLCDGYIIQPYFYGLILIENNDYIFGSALYLVSAIRLSLICEGSLIIVAIVVLIFSYNIYQLNSINKTYIAAFFIIIFYFHSCFHHSIIECITSILSLFYIVLSSLNHKILKKLIFLIFLVGFIYTVYKKLFPQFIEFGLKVCNSILSISTNNHIKNFYEQRSNVVEMNYIRYLLDYISGLMK